MTKLAFFDVDGTLSAPRYPVNGELRIGMSDEAWLRFCLTHPRDAYRDCLPVPAVQRYAQELKKSGARLFVLTASQLSRETEAKRVFIDSHYPGLFEDLIAVSENRLKVPVILEMASLFGVPAENCELVEDTYSLLLEAEGKGIRGTHAANLAAVY